jgi:hypothetical protein
LKGFSNKMIEGILIVMRLTLAALVTMSAGAAPPFRFGAKKEG